MQILSSIYPRCAAVVARSSEEHELSRADVGAEALASYPIPPTNETGTGPVTKTAFSFEVNRPDTMNVTPPWVNESPKGIQGGSRDRSLTPLDPNKREADDSTSPSTTSSALPGLSYPKAVEAKAAAFLSSGGNFIIPSL